jgi:hypothetical protein
MEQERWRRVKEIFGAALHAPVETQPQVLDALCADDADLRAEVVSLLRASLEADAAAWDGPRRRRTTSPDAPFEPDARFQLDARLGSGGFGVVYRAFDRKLERWVALKTLRRHAPDALARFKHEFRALADLAHPNLLRLFELFVGERDVYFSMELIEGVPLAAAALHGTADAGARWRRAAGLFADLAEGVRALHAAGVLHRDLKPSNVLVTPDDRVVVLDFGLVAGVPESSGTQISQVMGTPAYMAPERLAGQSAHEASDWYSVGVMLREALEPDAAAPPGLASLALELTADDASARPRGAEILGRLRRLAGQRRGDAAQGPVETPEPGRAPFVGRRVPLAALERAYARACAGHIAVARVRGPSGIGKTALVGQFLAGLRGDARHPLVLRARCHDREALGFKALDGIVDGLAQHLRRLPVHEAEALLPSSVLELARLFPVLLQAPAVASARRRLFGTADSIELRRRAFDALRELFGRLLHVTPVVLFIDDLQWGDLDSAALLRHLVRGQDAPPLLVIACWREQGIAARDAGPLSEALAANPAALEDVDLEALAPDEVRAYVRAELGEREGAEGLIEAVVREAAGVPIFAQELVREAKRAPATLIQGGAVVQLDAVLAARVERLPPQQRALLETVALAAKPLERAAARRAAALEGPLAHDAEQALLAAKLLRHGDGGDALETYHDRIRELVTRLVAPARAARLHDGLVQGLLADGGADPEDLAYHLRAAGRLDEAADAAARAARRAAEALAFDRAAALYTMALDLRAADDHPEAGALAVGLADALAFAGRATEAADAYVRASSKLPEQHLSLTCKAAEQLLQSGDVTRGKAIVKELLGTLGWSVPERPAALLASVVLRRAELALRGLRFKLRREDEVPQRRLVRLDASWALVSGLSLIDTVHASYFQNHHLLQALAVGEPRRLLRALTGEAAYCSMPGTKRSRRRAEAVLATLRRIAAQHPGEPIGEPMVAIGTSMTAWMYGDWRTSQREAAVAARAFRDRCTGVTWELGTARTFMMGTLTYMGDYVEYERHWPGFVEDARARGDVFAETKLVLIDLSHAAALAKDDADGASAAVARALGMWHSEGFHLQHFWALHARVEIALYRGDPATAWTLLQDARQGLRRSLLLRVQQLRLWLRQTRARAALALAAHDPTARERLLAVARAEARAIGREGTPWGAGMASLFGGLILEREGDAERAAARLDDAASRLDAAHMAVYAAAARRARGRLAGPDTGAAPMREAEALMRARGVHDPARFAAMLAPGPR